MPRSGRARSLTADEIVDAALHLIKHEGFSRLTMRAVSSELGVTPMAVYHYVEDKEDLVRLVIERVSASRAPLRVGRDGWQAALRTYLVSAWEEFGRYPGLGAYMIELPTLGVTPERMQEGLQFFEDAGFPPAMAGLAWSFALTYIHGRMSVDARLGHNPDAPRFGGLRAHDYVDFGVEAVILGLTQLRDSGAEPGSVKRSARAASRS